MVVLMLQQSQMKSYLDITYTEACSSRDYKLKVSGSSEYKSI